MAQPPYRPPGPYPPYGYGQRPSFGPPPLGYGAPGPYGQPPRKTNLVPWLIAGGAVLLSALGILLVVLLRDAGSRTPTAAMSSAAVPSSSSAAAAGPSGPRHAGLPGGAHVADKDTGAGRARFARSGATALAWVRAMADGEFRTAYDLSCAEVKQSATAAAEGGDPARSLAASFFEHTLSGRGFTDGSFDSVMYNSASDSDIASFTLRLDDGEEFVLLVYVQSDGTVREFV